MALTEDELTEGMFHQYYACMLVELLNNAYVEKLQSQIDDLADDLSPAAQEKAAELRAEIEQVKAAVDLVVRLPMHDLEEGLRVRVPDYERRLKLKKARQN